MGANDDTDGKKLILTVLGIEMIIGQNVQKPAVV